MPPFKRDSYPLPWSGVPANADKLLPAMTPARTDVSCETVSKFRSASLLTLVSGYMALELSNQVFYIGEKPSSSIDART